MFTFFHDLSLVRCV